MRLRHLFPICIAAILLAGCGGLPPAATPSPTPVTAEAITPVVGMPQGTDGYPWWNDTVFYEIFVRSFYDSDGDGIGDFNGIIAKLDYLNDGDPNTTADLGVTGIWLMPIHPSPSYHGYDVTNYWAVNPEYGSMDDFKRMISEAHKRGIRVIIDLVLNHTSSQHAWFVAAQDPNSPYRDYYIWSETKPDYIGPWGQQVWYKRKSGYYYALFWEHMPDLNYNNPEVTTKMENVVRFWLDEVGVNGFRLDAAKHLIEEGALQANTESTHAWFAEFRPFYKSINPDALMIGEVWEDNVGVVASYVQGDQLDLTFDFGLAEAFVESARSGKALTVNGTLKLDYRILPRGQFAVFLTNHDQDRVMSQLRGEVNKAKAAASLLLTSPGVPFIYYGEEIGMEGQKPDEDIRRPMQWSAERHAGFSTNFPWRSPGPDWETYNVAAEMDDPNSLLSHYRSLIHLRNQHAALRVGDLYLIRTGNQAIFASLRLSHDEAVLIVINLGSEPVTGYSLLLESSALPAGQYLDLPLMGEGPFADLTVGDSGNISGYMPLAEIPAYGTLIMQLHLK